MNKPIPEEIAWEQTFSDFDDEYSKLDERILNLSDELDKNPDNRELELKINKLLQLQNKLEDDFYEKEERHYAELAELQGRR